MEIPPKKMVKLATYKLKSRAAIWWDQMYRSKAKLGQEPMWSWGKKKQLMVDCFLPVDYKQHLLKVYHYFKQGTKSTHDYMIEILKIVDQNNLGDTED